jgi:hypothetical protein
MWSTRSGRSCLSFRHQLLEDVPRNVLTQPELFDENGVVLGALEHVQKTEVGNAGAVIRSYGSEDVAVSTRHQFVCHDLGNGFSPGYRQQMRLALGPDIVDQHFGIEALAVLQDRACDFDRIVGAKPFKGVDRCVGDIH